MIEFNECPVAINGSMVLPAPIRSVNWGIKKGIDSIRATDLDKGVLVIPAGAEWKLLEGYYPETELSERATLKANLHTQGKSNTPRPLEEATLFTSYKINSVGAFTLPATARNRWEMPHGRHGKYGNRGKVNVVDLLSGAVVLPTNADIHEVVPEIVPVEVFKRNAWTQQREPHPSFFSAAYRDWKEEQGSAFLNLALKGGETHGYPLIHDTTTLGRQMEAFVTADVLKAATHQAEKRIYRGK